MAIFLTHGGTTHYSSDSLSDEVMIGTVSGIFVIQRENARKWRLARKTLEGCHISALVFEPQSGLIFAGAHKGSIHASDDLGKTWHHRDNGLTTKDVYCINFVQAQNKTMLYAGTEPARLFQSENLGETWSELQSLRSVASAPKWNFPVPPRVPHVKNIAFDPRNPRIIYACIEQGGLLKSNDGGASWEDLQGFDEDVHRIRIRTSNPDWLFIATRAGVYQSQNGGKSWEQLTTESTGIGYPDALLIHPQRENLMFMAGARTRPFAWIKDRTADSQIARSRDGGKNWEILHQGLPEHVRGNMEAMVMEVTEESVALFAGTSDGEIFHSDDEGEQWTKIIENLPPLSKAHHYLNFR